MKVLITGASAGIGRALAAALVKAGNQVWGVARRPEALADLGRELGEGFFFSPCDILSPADVDRAVSAMRGHGFVPDCVILNAGVLADDMADGYDHKIGARILATNVDGALVWVERWLGDFRKRGSGQFIAVSSILAFRPDIHSAAYPASKAALSMAFRSLRLRYAPENLRFKAVHLGPVVTGIAAPRSGQPSRRSACALTPEQAAAGIIQVLESRRSEFYVPFLATALCRLTQFLPDALFEAMTRPLRR